MADHQKARGRASVDGGDIWRCSGREVKTGERAVKRSSPERCLATDNSERDQSYRVGYGKPPPQLRFRPGDSGNPRGRPKGIKNTSTLARELLDRKISVRTGGNAPRQIMVVEAILTR